VVLPGFSFCVHHRLRSLHSHGWAGGRTACAFGRRHLRSRCLTEHRHITARPIRSNVRPSAMDPKALTEDGW